MKESYNEGLASHIGPESCLDTPRGGREALTGESTGGLLNSEITSYRPGRSAKDAVQAIQAHLKERKPPEDETKRPRHSAGRSHLAVSGFLYSTADLRINLPRMRSDR